MLNAWISGSWFSIFFELGISAVSILFNRGGRSDGAAAAAVFFIPILFL
jgi:hypothetical protein